MIPAFCLRSQARFELFEKSIIYVFDIKATLFTAAKFCTIKNFPIAVSLLSQRFCGPNGREKLLAAFSIKEETPDRYIS